MGEKFDIPFESLESSEPPVGRGVIQEFRHAASSPKHRDHFLKLTVTLRLLVSRDMNVREWCKDLLWVTFFFFFLSSASIDSYKIYMGNYLP